MAKFNSEELERVIRGFYSKADRELVTFLKAQGKKRTELYSQIGEILLTYEITNDIVNLSAKEQAEELQKLEKWIKLYVESEALGQIALIRGLLGDTAEGTCKFYSYNKGREAVDKIVNTHYKGKHFSDRVWDNEEEVGKLLKKKATEFVRGKTTVNKIKKELINTFNASDYNAQRLAYTEIARVQAQSFLSFAKEVNVNKVVYNAKLDSKTCSDCIERDLKKYKLEDAPELPTHPNCRCYYEVADDIEDLDLEEIKTDTPRAVSLTNEEMGKWGKSRDDFEDRSEYISYRKEKRKFIEEKIEEALKEEHIYNDIKEAEKVLNGLGVKYVNLEGIDSFYYDDLIRATEYTLKNYPKMLDYVEFIGNQESYSKFVNTTMRSRNIDLLIKEDGMTLREAEEYLDKYLDTKMELDISEIAVADKGFILNSRLFEKKEGNIEYMLKSDIDNRLSGFGVNGKGGLYDTVTHELGHCLKFSMENRGINVERDIIGVVKEKYPDFVVSQYSLTNNEEYFAEMFLKTLTTDKKDGAVKLFEKLLKELDK